MSRILVVEDSPDAHALLVETMWGLGYRLREL